MASSKGITNLGLDLLRFLPRVTIDNIKSKNPKRKTRGRGQHGGDKHGCGNKSGQRQNFLPLGFETGNTPFHIRMPFEPYHNNHHIRREYPPLSMNSLQMMIDTNRLDTTKPIDLTALNNTGLLECNPIKKHYGIQLTDEGANEFKAKINIEVQHATELVIATIERNGGVISTAYYDIQSLIALLKPAKFFERGIPIFKRMVPPQDAIEYYSSAKRRGYLADPEQISFARLELSQKYGYTLPEIEKDPDYEMLTRRKDPRQIFYGLQPGWVVNLHDKTILKPTDPEYLEYYNS